MQGRKIAPRSAGLSIMLDILFSVIAISRYGVAVMRKARTMPMTYGPILLCFLEAPRRDLSILTFRVAIHMCTCVHLPSRSRTAISMAPGNFFEPAILIAGAASAGAAAPGSGPT